MDERGESLNMTVHLLASSGDLSLLQRTIDQLVHWICPGIQLFLVSARVRSFKYYEKYHKKRSGFPGMSVLLFLHEDLGEERIVQMVHFFQHPPWQYHHTENSSGRFCSYMLASQDFYSLDAHMPVWGIRQVHYGTEILRVTLYCHFDNYEDAVRLYEMILQKEATVQKSNFCFFVLYSTESVSVQFSLKQLPPGVPVELKESSVLQFRVQEIGQLVPLLPNQCIPISNTRWQTQDYDGNKILLQVPGSSIVRQVFLSCQPEEKDLHNLAYSCQNTAPNKKATGKNMKEPLPLQRPGDRCQDISGETSDLSESLASGSPCSTLQSGSYCSSQCNSPAVFSEPKVPSQSRISSQEYSVQSQEAETNVDTGFTVVNSGYILSSFSRFSRDLQYNLPSHFRPQNYLSAISGAKINFSPEESVHQPLIAVKSEKAELYLSGISQKHLSNGKEEEEEFFI
uniref:Protein FAM124B isoform X3 n=1 Tax=Geotrypetes seraphini TaxID=260995 RepID=A0A6P8S8Y9_GEOSA|nr:protein FAM124B isoform X3 [Geotrypetes seraphini]XP_033814648.1 protein FAM124B isoform X3 [Geotrypetes seraphini]XP_033814649.1 protein FAM124B isoform X3 [Geotrypetes seraphini]